MKTLLLAEPSYERIRASLHEVLGSTEIGVVTIDGDGEFKSAERIVDASDIDISYLRLDWDLFGLGQMRAVLELIDQASHLEFVQTSAAGLDNPMFKKVIAKAGAFCNSDAQAPAIAEYVVASVLNRWQRFDVRAARQADKEWRGNSFKEVIDSNWLLIGFGNICQRIARPLQGFGAHVTAIRRTQEADDLADQVDSLDNLRKYLADADVVVLGCALNDETRGLVDAAFLQQMKSDAILVNIARGGVIVEEDLLQALNSEQIDFAVLDVFDTEPLPEDHPFWTNERVQVTPHSSNSGIGTGKRGDALFLDNLQRHLNHQALRNLVDPTTI